MINNVPPRTVFYALMVLLITAAFLHVLTDIKQFIDVAMLIGGIIVIIRPKILLELIQDENKKGKIDIDPLFSEKVYKILGFCGGFILVVIGLGHLLFNLKI